MDPWKMSVLSLKGVATELSCQLHLYILEIACNRRPIPTRANVTRSTCWNYYHSVLPRIANAKRQNWRISELLGSVRELSAFRAEHARTLR